MTLRTSAQRSFLLGIVALAAVVVCHLALTDIWHGEGDLSLEWRVLQIGFLVIVIALFSAMATLRRVLKEIRTT